MKSGLSRIDSLNEEEKYLLFNIFFLLSFIIYLLAVFLSDGHSEKDERRIYLLFFSIGPLLNFAFYRTIHKKNRNILLVNALFCFYGYLLLAFMAALFLVSHCLYVIYLFCLFHFVGTLCIYRIYVPHPSAMEGRKATIAQCNNLICFIFPPVFIILTVLFNGTVRSYLMAKIWHSHAFQAGMLAGFIITAFIFIPSKLKIMRVLLRDR